MRVVVAGGRLRLRVWVWVLPFGVTGCCSESLWESWSIADKRQRLLGLLTRGADGGCSTAGLGLMDCASGERKFL